MLENTDKSTKGHKNEKGGAAAGEAGGGGGTLRSPLRGRGRRVLTR